MWCFKTTKARGKGQAKNEYLIHWSISCPMSHKREKDPGHELDRESKRNTLGPDLYINLYAPLTFLLICYQQV